MAIREFNGKMPSLGQSVFVDERAVVIGSVTVGDDVSIWPGAVLRGDVNRIEIGSGSNVQDGAILHGTHAGPFSPDGIPLLIGSGVTVGHRAVLHACTVGAGCLIGMGAILMDGALIPDWVLIAAGSLVPPGSMLERRHLYRGVPARKIRPLTDRELEFLDYSSLHYRRLKEQYLGAGD